MEACGPRLLEEEAVDRSPVYNRASVTIQSFHDTHRTAAANHPSYCFLSLAPQRGLASTRGEVTGPALRGTAVVYREPSGVAYPGSRQWRAGRFRRHFADRGPRHSGSTLRLHSERADSATKNGVTSAKCHLFLPLDLAVCRIRPADSSPVITAEGEVLGILTLAGSGKFRGLSFGASLEEAANFLKWKAC